ncbi:type II toxin-antitoxin system MqsR family toxin [Alphaproteobacteria bacterium]|jgi:motility quorum-sensing regulator / GCU-specific mRNA interferase toxin|nr:type II toxin-antitoxin system MqsR family toxin [Alphaproteobacteria bacterium]
MEKRKPSFDLERIKSAFASIDDLNVTGSAVRSAAKLGFGRLEIVQTIQNMQRRQFIKSMTLYNNHRIWQDVYHVTSEAGMLYVKFTEGVISEFLLLSFKEKDNE